MTRPGMSCVAFRVFRVLSVVLLESPAPIPAHEVEAILRRIEEGIEKPRPKTLFEVGEEVRIIDGPFAEFMGTVEEVMYEKSRLKVSVLILVDNPGGA